MMEGGEVLLTAAELSLALAGFGSIVAAFRGGRPGWGPMEVVRFRALIVISLGAALIALLPFPFGFGGYQGAALWRMASTLSVCLIASVLALMLWYARSPMRTHGSAVWSGVAIGLALTAGSMHALNALGVGFRQSIAGYFSGLLLLMVLAGLYFLRLIVVSGPRAGPDQPR